MEIIASFFFFFFPIQFKGIYLQNSWRRQLSFPVLGELPFWQGKQWLLQINFEYKICVSIRLLPFGLVK